jgi:hypothetical protein
MHPFEKATAIQRIKESIDHWERMYSDPDGDEEPFADDCPLCQEYMDDEVAYFWLNGLTASEVGELMAEHGSACFDDLEARLACDNCPIAQYTGSGQCKNTPYTQARNKWHSAQTSFLNLRPAKYQMWREAARAEIGFLHRILKYVETL